MCIQKTENILFEKDDFTVSKRTLKKGKPKVIVQQFDGPLISLPF